MWTNLFSVVILLIKSGMSSGAIVWFETYEDTTSTVISMQKFNCVFFRFSDIYFPVHPHNTPINGMLIIEYQKTGSVQMLIAKKHRYA